MRESRKGIQEEVQKLEELLKDTSLEEPIRRGPTVDEEEKKEPEKAESLEKEEEQPENSAEKSPLPISPKKEYEEKEVQTESNELLEIIVKTWVLPL